MKKFLMVILTCVMLTLMSGVALADEAKVTVSVANGDAVLVQQPVTVTDTDEDGALTIADALYCAHEAYFEGGAAAGFACSVGQYGLQLDKLWGVDNGTGYGYYVNNAGANGLADPVKDGDSVYAFVYTDTVGWSDQFSYFDKDTATAEEGGKIKLTLSGSGYDANWAPITVPVAGAKVLLDGKETGVTTGEDGSFELELTASGEHVISAKAAEGILVPPLCVVKVSAKDTPTPTPTTEPTKEPTVAPTTAPTATPAAEEAAKDTVNPLVIVAICLILAIFATGVVLVIKNRK